jgi:hypothetical protein
MPLNFPEQLPTLDQLKAALEQFYSNNPSLGIQEVDPRMYQGNEPETFTPEKFTTRPLVIDAVKFDGKHFTNLKICKWAGDFANYRYCFVFGVSKSETGDLTLAIKTDEGWKTPLVGDYIIKWPYGSFWVCKPEVFSTLFKKYVK